MHRKFLGVAVTLLAIPMTGCGFLNESQTNAVVEAPAPAAEAVPPAASEAEPQTFPSPKVAVPAKKLATAALTRPTDPNERLRVIQSGRPDPFADLVPAKSAESKPAPGPAPKPTVRPSSERLSPPKVTVRPSSGKPPAPSPGGIVLPELPEPELAKGVKVQGIMSIAGVPQAIVQASGEDLIRTIKVGDRLSNGQVLVKSIDPSNPSGPVIILEEAGATISVGVGSDPVVIASAKP